MLVFSDAQVAHWIANLFWPFVRIAAVFTVAPVLALRQIPARFRVLLAVLITFAIQPMLPPVPVVSPFSAAAGLILAQQFLIGTAMGFLLLLAFNALIYGGQAMAFSMGLGFAFMVDPQNGVQVPVVSQFWMILAMLAFLLVNGHLVLFQMLADSFTVLPIAVDGIGRAGLWELAAWASRMFAAGVLMAMPILMSLLLINLGMGMVTRAAPQLNIFAVGFPMTLMMGFVLMWIMVPHVMDGFGSLLVEAFDAMGRILVVNRG